MYIYITIEWILQERIPFCACTHPFDSPISRLPRTDVSGSPRLSNWSKSSLSWVKERTENGWDWKVLVPCFFHSNPVVPWLFQLVSTKIPKFFHVCSSLFPLKSQSVSLFFHKHPKVWSNSLVNVEMFRCLARGRMRKLGPTVVSLVVLSCSFAFLGSSTCVTIRAVKSQRSANLRRGLFCDADP